MDMDNSFEAALSEALDSQPRKLAGNPLTFSRFKLADNQALSVHLCNSIAEYTGQFMTETGFMHTPQRSLSTPISPDPNDARFLLSKNKKYPPALIEKYGLAKVRAVDTAKAYKQALDAHKKETQIHSRLRAQTLFVRDAFSQDRMGYLDYVFTALRVMAGQSTRMAIPKNVSLADLAFSGNRESPLSQIPQKPLVPAGFVDSFFFTSRDFAINEVMRWRHTFICGATGSGKSQTILNIIRHYLTVNTDTAVVVFDPHGEELAQVTAQFREFAQNDRLAYIDAKFDPKHRVGFNPFDTTDKSEAGLNALQGQLAAAIGQLFEQGMSPQMENVLIPCVGVLLHRDNSTLTDLYHFMDDDSNHELVKHGQTALPNEFDREFFKRDFVSKEYSETKLALRRRLFKLLRDPDIRSFLCGESTFDLESLIEQGKVIVFNFRKSAVNEDVTKTIGQLLTAYISGYAVRRYRKRQGSRRRVHLILDECQYFTSPQFREILTETRKYRLHATLATQTFDQLGKTEKAVIDLVVANVGVFHVGTVAGQTATKMAKVMSLKDSDLENQQNLGFVVYERGKRAIHTTVPYVGAEKFAMKPEQWQQVKARQLESYYRPLVANEPIEDGASPLPSPAQPIPQSPETKFGDWQSLDTIKAANQRRKPQKPTPSS